MILDFDYGHGGADSGANYKGRKESDDVLSLGKAVASEVRRHGVIVDEARTSDVALNLSARSTFENKKNYDYFIAFHRNAFQPEKAQGVETFTYPHSSVKAKQLAAKVQSSLVEIGFVDRKLKEANFHVLRETKSAAILVEVGFIDNTADNKLFDSKRNEIVKALAKAILAQCGVKYIDKIVKEIDKGNIVTAPKGHYYKIQVGAYSYKDNADAESERINKLGVKAFVTLV